MKKPHKKLFWKTFKKVVDKKSWGDKIEKFAKRTERFKEGMSEEEAKEG